MRNEFRNPSTEQSRREKKDGSRSEATQSDWGACRFTQNGQLTHVSPEFIAKYGPGLLEYRKETQRQLLQLDRAEHIEGEAGVRGFYDALRLSTAPHVPLTETGVAQLRQIIPSLKDLDNINLCGTSIEAYNVVFTVPGRMSPDLNKPYILAHELGHSTSNEDEVVGLDIETFSVSGLQNGFVQHLSSGETIGTYLEEAVAELLSASYRERNFSVPSTEPDRLHGKYTYGDNKCSTSAHAATGLELLIAKDPHLFATVINSRRDRQYLAEFKARIERLDPGLHDQLTYNENLQDNTYLIADRLYDGDYRTLHYAPELAQTQNLIDDYMRSVR